MRVYVCASLATGRRSEQPGAAHCAPQFTADVSRWMPPFTNTASPLAAALAALLLSFLLLCKKKRGKRKKAIKAGQKRARMQVVYLEKEKKKKARGSGVGVCLYVGWWFFSRGPHFLCLNIHAWMRSPLRDFHNHSVWVIYLWFRCLCTGSTYILSFLKWSISSLTEQVEETMKWEHFVTSALQEACLGLKFMLRVKRRIRSVSLLLSFSFYTYTQYRTSQHASKKRELLHLQFQTFSKRNGTNWGVRQDEDGTAVHTIKMFYLFNFAKQSMQSRPGWSWLRILLKTFVPFRGVWPACDWCAPAAIMTEQTQSVCHKMNVFTS